MQSRAERALSPRQAEIANLVKIGKTSRQIGEILFIDPRTVDSHIEAICNKLGVRTRVELVVALLGPGTDVSADSTAVRTPNTNLPLPRTALIGRETEVADIVRLLQDDRLVTVTGAGGVGKTRTALAVGDAVLAGMKGGVWLVDLAPLAQGSFVTGALAQALNVQESRNRSLRETLLAHLKQQALLLILDNCEHVVAEAAGLADALLRGCPHLRILSTSRESLRIAGERTYRLPSLHVPTPRQALRLSAADAGGYAALALFAQRAQASDRGFALSDDNAPIVADICRRLDGIPLAIELAAARVKILSLGALSIKLNQRFRILTGGDRTALPRHQTMRALIDWSYDLLTPPEQRLFERLSIFADGCTLTAAATVCDDALDDELGVLELLSSLVDKSLVVTDLTGREPRYHLPESSRPYALEKLEEHDERETIVLRHALWAAAFADELAELAWTTPRRAWLERIFPEVNNARAALTWALGPGGEPMLAGRIAAGLAGYWHDRGLGSEGTRYIESALERLDESLNPELTARLWLAASSLRTGSRRAETAEHANTIFERLGNRRRLATGYYTLAVAYYQLTKFCEAEAAIDQALALFRETGTDRSVYYAAAMGWRALAVVALGRYDDARTLFAGSIALLKALGDTDRAALEQLNFAELERAAGDVPRSLELVEQALDVLRTGAQQAYRVDDFFLATASLNAAAYHLVLGQLDRARLAAREALMLARSVQYPIYTAVAMQHIATIAALRNNERAAARLRGFVDAVYRSEGSRREPTEQQVYEILATALESNLSDGEITRLAAEGKLLSEDEAVDMSFDILTPIAGARHHSCSELISSTAADDVEQLHPGRNQSNQTAR